MLNRQHSTSMSGLGYNSLQKPREAKIIRRTHSSLYKLKLFRTAYEQPYKSVRPEHTSP